LDYVDLGLLFVDRGEEDTSVSEISRNLFQTFMGVVNIRYYSRWASKKFTSRDSEKVKISECGQSLAFDASDEG